MVGKKLLRECEVRGQPALSGAEQQQGAYETAVAM